MSVTKTVVALPSPSNDGNYFRAMVDRMVVFLRTVAIGEVVTYERLKEVIETDEDAFARRVYHKAKESVKIHDGMFFKTRHNVGYERVTPDESVSVCETDITRGMKQVWKGVSSTHYIDLNALSENKRNRVVGIQTSYGNLKLLQDLSGN